MNRGRESGGFTLLEILIALAIMALIVSIIYSSFSTASRNVHEAEATRDSADLARTLIAKLSEDIGNAYLNPAMRETIFYGKKSEIMSEDAPRFDSIALTTLTNWRRPNTKEMDLWEVSYRFDDKPEGTGKVLIRREKRELAEDVPPLEGGTDFVLTDRVKALRLRYSTGTPGASWEDEWDSRTRHALPKAVEIVLSLDDGSIYTTEVRVGQ